MTCTDGFASQKNFLNKTTTLSVSELIKKRIAEAGYPPNIILRGELIRAPDMLERFYEKRDFQPVWSGNEGPLPKARELIEAIENAKFEGLIPYYYHLEKIKSLLWELSNKKKKIILFKDEDLVAFDLLLTDAFLMLGCHYSSGCVDPLTIEAEWFITREILDVVSVLDSALKKDNIEEALKKLLPPGDSYSRLRSALDYYRKILVKGGWPIVTDGPALKKGVKSRRIIELRKRLTVSGDMDIKDDKKSELFEEGVKQAVLKFQKMHGLETDGVVGPLTLKMLNVSAKERVRQLELNMERMRWSFRDLGQRYIIVNIADFELYVVENGEILFNMKVVVGKPFRQTPVFSKKMTYIVINPSWNVPKSIAIEDILPKIKKDADYLAKQKIKVIKGWDKNSEEIDPETINWSKVAGNNFNYWLQQEPGILNPLGGIKFMLPNRFGVYLHDSPSRRLFAESKRSFSHGCIRVERAVDLAEYLLKSDPDWTREKIVDAIEDGKEQEVPLPEPINVHILYLTAWVDNDGFIQFREDIYGRDEQLDKSLRKEPPKPLLSQ
ncbi:MAG: hypothetical protein A2Y97_04655 [Nitrospirae bacterium RBG_13_39_12]|nr:MAG: hypothetical protein A2Y97_04655 [Nitrospirae bacterium RBG_13_39_12]